MSAGAWCLCACAYVCVCVCTCVPVCSEHVNLVKCLIGGLLYLTTKPISFIFLLGINRTDDQTYVK